MEIILVCAGGFEDTAEGKTLGDKARKQIDKVAQGIQRALPKKIKAEVWSSFDPHMSQLADLVADEIGIKRKFVRSITQDDIDELLKIIRDYGKDRTLVVIADHSRAAGWLEALLGFALPCREFSVAGLDLTLGDATAAELLWFAQPHITQRLR
jgi:hypothetical protein